MFSGNDALRFSSYIQTKTPGKRLRYLAYLSNLTLRERGSSIHPFPERDDTSRLLVRALLAIRDDCVRYTFADILRSMTCSDGHFRYTFADPFTDVNGAVPYFAIFHLIGHVFGTGADVLGTFGVGMLHVLTRCGKLRCRGR